MSQRETPNKLRKVSLRRGLVLAAFVLMGATVLYFQVAQPPFVAIPSRSMEPTLHVGDIILVEPVDAADIKVGDIVVVSVPGSIQERYGYPPSIVHRVVNVEIAGTGMAFRTKGDNTGEDPFTTFPEDIRGRVHSTLPNIGFLVLFLRSHQGLVFLAASCAIYLAQAPELRGGARWLGGRLSAALFSDVLAHVDRSGSRQEEASAKVTIALGQFADAMSEYATHLRSHTAAVRSMALAAEDIRDAVRGGQPMTSRHGADGSGDHAQPSDKPHESGTPR